MHFVLQLPDFSFTYTEDPMYLSKIRIVQKSDVRHIYEIIAANNV